MFSASLVIAVMGGNGAEMSEHLCIRFQLQLHLNVNHHQKLLSMQNCHIFPILKGFFGLFPGPKTHFYSTVLLSGILMSAGAGGHLVLVPLAAGAG